MTMSAWPFLITCNRDLDYMTVVAPDFVCEAGAGHEFGRYAGGEPTPAGHAYRREVRDERAGALSLFYRVVEATSDMVGEPGGRLLTDTFGRRVLLIEGLVLRQPHAEPALTAAHLERAHEAVAPSFREFWGRVSWMPRGSDPLSLEGAGREAADALTLISREPVGGRERDAREREGRGREGRAARAAWEADFLDPPSHEGAAVTALAFSRDGRVLASRRLGGPLRLWDAGGGGLVENLKLRAFEADVNCPFGFSPSTSARVFMGINVPMPGKQSPYAVVLWDRDVVASDDSPNCFAIMWAPAPIRLLCLPAGGRSVVFVDEDDTACDLVPVRTSFLDSLIAPPLHVYEPRSATRLGYRAESLAVSPDGRHRVTGDDHGVVRLYRGGFDERVFAERAHGSQVTAAAFLPGGRHFATAGRDCEIVLWDVKSRAAVRRLDEHRQAVKWLLFSEDRDTMVSGDVGGEIKVWDCRKKLSLKETFKADGFSLTALALSPDGRRIASATDRNRIQLWRRSHTRRGWDDEDDE